jgi:hypothetical protein
MERDDDNVLTNIQTQVDLFAEKVGREYDKTKPRSIDNLPCKDWYVQKLNKDILAAIKLKNMDELTKVYAKIP